MAYTVAKGDTLSAIAKRLGVSVTDLYNANRGVIGGNPNAIKPGQVLQLPGQGGPAAPAGGTDLAKALDQYGFVGTLAKSIPELKGILEQAAREEWQPARFQRAVEDSGWWKQNADSMRQLAILQATDPATYQQNLSNAATKVMLIADQMGYRVDGNALALRALLHNYDEQQIRYVIGTEGSITRQEGRPDALWGDAGQVQAQLQKIATDYGVAHTPQFIEGWIKQVQSGQNTVGGFESLMRARAKTAYTQFADQIDAGMTVRDIADPWISTMANTLEMSSGSITLDDPLVKKALTQRDPKTGAATSMPLWQFERTLKDDPRWDKTKQARDQTASVLAQIGKDWGFVGGGR